MATLKVTTTVRDRSSISSTDSPEITIVPLREQLLRLASCAARSPINTLFAIGAAGAGALSALERGITSVLKNVRATLDARPHTDIDLYH